MLQNPTDSTELDSSSSLSPPTENDPITFTHTQPINDKEHFRLSKEHSDDRIFSVLTPTLPVAVLMSLAQPSTEPVSTREPSLLHARQVSAPLCPS